MSGKNENAVPTNLITYKGRRIPARIDPDASILRVVEIMAKSFNAAEHHITLALRDENDVLVTQQNIGAMVSQKDTLKLVSAPVTEALAVVASLHTAKGKEANSEETEATTAIVLPDKVEVLPLKLALFNLQKFIKEDDFAVEFMLKGGVSLLVELVEKDDEKTALTGNSLAYALQGIRGVMDYDNGWGEFTDDFIDRILIILASSSAPNIVRPATVIVRKLITASPKGHSGKGKQRAPSRDAVNNYGFDRVFARILVIGHKAPDEHGSSPAERIFKPIVKRLEGTRDLELSAQSLALINASLRSAHQEGSKRYSDLITVIEALNTRKYVARLMSTSANNIVEPRILDFQTRYANVLRYHSLRPVRPQTNPTHERYLREIWMAGRLDEEDAGDMASPRPSMADYQASNIPRTWEGWRRVGLSIDFVDNTDALVETELFRSVGELGLNCLHYYTMHEESFRSIVLEQQARPVDRRCPIGRASAECVKILNDHYKITQSSQRSLTHFTPFMLNFPRLHSLVMKFFLRMWHDSESRLDDFDRLSYLVASQVRQTLAEEHTKTWLNLERDFLGTNYRDIREGQMEMIEKEDGLLERGAVVALRGKVSKEATEVMSDQRVICMMRGSWFNAVNVLATGVDQMAHSSPSRPLRFVMLSPDKRTLAWSAFAARPKETPVFASLKEHIDLGNVTSVKLQTGCAIGSRSPDQVSKLSFSLMSGKEASLLDLDAIHAQQFAEWTDGLRAIKAHQAKLAAAAAAAAAVENGRPAERSTTPTPEMGGMTTQESSNYVHILTELALKIRLLDITGDGIEIPPKVGVGSAPRSTDFWFAS
ncbi:hypothetical protein CspeluHIS016_0203560 [Cutaneotrichosporon spelunceum]|uniref:ELMO domain-containing protein n=1 Tax=Cutaneotrichosporon spelunceum TaxID=1672016 RepID=A0AAD3TRW9_9TREE|nr:hypothetical protein CspeluHIS016_0203560 [Cutaneotrichosporon spelunceum]